MRNHLICLLLLGFQLAAAQAPKIDWQKTYGGFASDQPSVIRQTRDGGFIIIGTTTSINVDITGNHGNTDLWILRINGKGAIEWQKCYGGSSSDKGFDIQQTSDGGYIAAGATSSNDGDLSGSPDTNTNSQWLLKIDHYGDKQWGITFKGPPYGEGHVIQLSDDSYMVSGDICTLSKVTRDGVLEWQKSCIGTLDSNTRIKSIIQTADGDFIMAGVNQSRKYNPGGPQFLPYGCIVKVNDTGMVMWQKIYETSSIIYSVKQTKDGNFLAGGNTYSNLVRRYHGGDDYWVMKFDQNGDTLWQFAYGGESLDVLSDLQTTSDNGCILSGYCSLGGDIVRATYPGGSDYWLVKLDQYGALEWQKAMGGSHHDESTTAIQTADGGYIAVGTITSNDFDITAYYGGGDYWVVKLNSATAVYNGYNQMQDNLIYPVPAKENIVIEGKPHATALLFSSVGQMVLSAEINSTKYVMDIHSIPSGLYYLQLKDNSGTRMIKKVIKE